MQRMGRIGQPEDSLFDSDRGHHFLPFPLVQEGKQLVKQPKKIAEKTARYRKQSNGQ